MKKQERMYGVPLEKWEQISEEGKIRIAKGHEEGERAFKEFLESRGISIQESKNDEGFRDWDVPDFDKKLSWLYLIQQIDDSDSNKSYYKVGVSKNPENRLRNLQTSNPCDLSLRLSYETYHYLELEKMFLDNFKRFSARGEWLYLYDGLVDEMLMDMTEMGRTVSVEELDGSINYRSGKNPYRPDGCHLYYLLKTKYTKKNMMPSEMLKKYKKNFSKVI